MHHAAQGLLTLGVIATWEFDVVGVFQAVQGLQDDWDRVGHGELTAAGTEELQGAAAIAVFQGEKEDSLRTAGLAQLHDIRMFEGA
jgi:hypothetical protein